MVEKRIGILTAGGDCPGLNAVIRGTVKAANQLGYEVVGFYKGYEGLADPVSYTTLTSKNTSGILTRGGTILGSTNSGRFVAVKGASERVDLDPDLLASVKQTFEQLKLLGLICVGGDGSLAVAQQFHEYGLPVVGVPKTIDNDLSSTAFTFGFDSAISCAADALDRLHSTAESHQRIIVLEVMGRHAGWIALYAGIAGGADVILVPEIPWQWQHVCHKVHDRDSRGKRFTIIVAAEGVELPEGGNVSEDPAAGAGQVRFGGVGPVIAEQLGRRLKRDTRAVVLGHLQRGGSPTTFDRVLATQFGAHAVRLVLEKRFGQVVCYNPPAMTCDTISNAMQLRQVKADASAVQAARAMGISFGDTSIDPDGSHLPWCEAEE